MKLRALALPLLLLLPGCFDTGDGDSSESASSFIALVPNEFLGEVPCRTGPSAMQTYVVTFVDITPGAGSAEEPLSEFELPSSGPVSCNQTVATGWDGAAGFIVPGHRYTARVAGYDRADILPLAPGSPIMISGDGSGAVVEPRWSTACQGAAECVEFTTQFVRECSPLTLDE
jgi:hypothetical protein